MRKDRDAGKKTGEKNGYKKEKNDENSNHYVIASSRPLERRTLVPKGHEEESHFCCLMAVMKCTCVLVCVCVFTGQLIY